MPALTLSNGLRLRRGGGASAQPEPAAHRKLLAHSPLSGTQPITAGTQPAAHRKLLAHSPLSCPFNEKNRWESLCENLGIWIEIFDRRRRIELRTAKSAADPFLPLRYYSFSVDFKISK